MGGYKEYESRGDKDKTLSIEQYLNKIIPYLKELINNHKAINNGSNEWKIQLNMCIKFVSLIDTKDICTFFVWSENNEIRLGNETDYIVNSPIPKTKDKDKTIPKTKDMDKDKNIHKTKTKDEDKATLKTKAKTKIGIKINNKKNLINKRLAKAKTKVTNKIKSVYKAVRKLQDVPWLRLVQLNKINAILDDAINVVWYEIYGENRKSSKMINIDKHKDIDGYVSKLTNIINDKTKSTKIMSMRIGIIMYNKKNKTNMVKEKIHKASEMGNDTLHLIDDNLNEIITYLRRRLTVSRKKLRVIAVCQTNCHKTLREILTAKISEQQYK